MPDPHSVMGWSQAKHFLLTPHSVTSGWRMKPALMGIFVPWESADAKHQGFILFFISFIFLFWSERWVLTMYQQTMGPRCLRARCNQVCTHIPVHGHKCV